VPDGSLLLDKTTINISDTAANPVQATELVNYLRQVPNHKVLGNWNLQLRTYSLSGADSTRWYNRWLRRLGKPPVIYSQRATDASANQLRLALINRGYLGATVDVDTVCHTAKKKIEVTYNVTPGAPHRLRSVSCDCTADSAVAAIIDADADNFTVNPGDNLDRNLLDAERTRLTNLLQEHGYYAFLKDYITFTADTAANSLDVDLTMTVRPPKELERHPIYRIRRVVFDANYSAQEYAENKALAALNDTVAYRDIYIVNHPDHSGDYIKPKMLWDNNFIAAGDVYTASQLNRTYEALGRLGIIKAVNIALEPTADEGWLDAVVRLNRNPLQGVSVELEGTNSEGDLGFGVGVTYQHRNIFHGSELLTIKGRGSYESISGDLDGIINNRYTEAGAEVALTLPRFRAPFLTRSFRQKVRASTEFALNFNYQERPEYTRVIAGAAWRYKWNNRNNTSRKIFDLLDVNYVYLPNSTINFLDEIAPTNPLLRYSYEDHLIVRMGFSLFKTNKVTTTPVPGQITPFRTNIYTIRASVEEAGNLLYGISAAVGQHKHDDAYKICGIPYAQYVKGDIDYMLLHNFDTRSSVAFRAGAGIGIPYGNSSAIPFEKRFYSGGANSVRGWGVRTLGPGRYDARNSVTDFINQCGDIRIDLNAEYRVKLFWVLEGAAFIDAGNVWTIRDYENQPGGQFKFSSFWKELAWAYGLGVRMDFTYFLLRFDLGMKAYNPAMNQEAWPIIHPHWKRDATFHFSVGYPF
jgi:outer membrane protein assembly factor BamA